MPLPTVAAGGDLLGDPVPDVLAGCGLHQIF